MTVHITHRLSETAYAALEKTVPSPVVDDKTTELQAGFRLGIQFILQKLREGYVVPDSPPSSS